jgi:3-hydroxyacyl-[acyl-carrier-protein] dehydratase
MIDIRGIMEKIPHRYPFLLVDRVVEMDEGKTIHALKNVTFNEPFFLGHFPDTPIMPGVLIIEAMAQAGALLALTSTGEGIENKLLLFRGIDGAKFRRAVVPGDQLHLYATTVKKRGTYWTFACEAKVDGELAAEAELSALVADRGEEKAT